MRKKFRQEEQEDDEEEWWELPTCNKEQLRDQPGEEQVAHAEEKEEEQALIVEGQQLGSEGEELQPQRPYREKRQPDRLQMSPQARKKKKAQARQKPKTRNPPSGI